MTTFHSALGDFGQAGAHKDTLFSDLREVIDSNIALLRRALGLTLKLVASDPGPDVF